MPLLLKRIIFFLLISFCAQVVFAATITGIVADEKGAPLPFASITVKGTGKGAVANSRGVYSLSLDAGTYTIMCHHVGYKTEEKTVTVKEENLQVNFTLTVQELTMPEVIIKRGEDPALEIMRETIKKRDYYNKQVDSMTVDVYIKGLVRSRSVPDRVFGQKIDKAEMQKEGMDASGRGILFLSESLTKVAYKHPDKLKLEVVSSRQSGGGFGLSVPFFVNFYKQNVELLGGNLAPRGFVSPLANDAFHYYKFRYEGNFFEGDKMIDRIKVTPRRKHEPLFEGFLQIVDGEWRIHSLSLSVNKSQGLDLLDTVKVNQIHADAGSNIWRTQNQVISFAANLFGFAVAGDFLNVYSNYNLNPGFGKKYFDRVLMKYDTAFDKHDSAYWSNLRPVPLEPDERRDFQLKDSLRKADVDSFFSEKNIDSLRKAQKRIKLLSFIKGGITRNFYSTTSLKTYRFESLLGGLQYNTVEGVSLSANQSFSIRPKAGKMNYEFGWNTQYGFNNHHLNSFGRFTLRSKEESLRNDEISFSGGKRLLQFNRDNPVDELTNSISTLFYRKNWIKYYEAWFGKGTYKTVLENGLRLNLEASYEDRIPVENSSDFSFFYKDRFFLPNHPYELEAIPFTRHAASVATITISYQPGQYFVELPKRRIAIGSKYPTFEAQYAKGFPGLFNSTADFDKWKFSVYDDANLKLWGTLRYRASVGGFLNNRHVDIPDFTHFNGNQTSFTTNYLNTFQLAPYYRYSNTEHFYTTLHAEHHFNGLLTNKIPLLNKLKWNLVMGTNTFYVNRDLYYVEAFAGLENIFKIFRVDFVTATQAAPGRSFGVRIGFGGVIGGNISVRK